MLPAWMMRPGWFLALLLACLLAGGVPATLGAEPASGEQAGDEKRGFRPLRGLVEGVGGLAGKLTGGQAPVVEDAPVTDIGASADRVIQDTPLPLDWARALASSGRSYELAFESEALDWEGLEARQVAGTLRVSEGRVAVEVDRLALGKGQVHGRLELDFSTEPPRISLELRAREVDVDDLRLGNVEGALADGLVDSRVVLDGRGLTLLEWLGSAEGEWDLLVQNGRAVRDAPSPSRGLLAGADLVRMLVPSGVNSTAIRCAVARVGISGGVAREQLLLVVTEHTAFIGDGYVDLRSEAVDLTFAPQSSAKVHGALLPPFSIEGTLGNPTTRMRPGRKFTNLGSLASLVASPLVTPALALSGKRRDCARALEDLAARPAADPQPSE